MRTLTRQAAIVNSINYPSTKIHALKSVLLSKISLFVNNDYRACLRYQTFKNELKICQGLWKINFLYAENDIWRTSNLLPSATSCAIIGNKGGVHMELSEILKSIRATLSISQEQLARDLNVSYTTLNRWENKRTSPSRLAKMRIADYCSEKGLPQSIIEEIKNT